MVRVLKRTGIVLWIIISLAIAWIVFYRPDWMVIPPKLDAMPISDKDPVNSLPDPNRPYYDVCGNEFDYMGNLISKGSGCLDLQQAEGFQGK